MAISNQQRDLLHPYWSSLSNENGIHNWPNPFQSLTHRTRSISFRQRIVNLILDAADEEHSVAEYLHRPISPHFSESKTLVLTFLQLYRPFYRHLLQDSTMFRFSGTVIFRLFSNNTSSIVRHLKNTVRYMEPSGGRAILKGLLGRQVICFIF